MKKLILLLLTVLLCSFLSSVHAAIDRNALVTRNSPHVTAIDTLASLTVGNGEFALPTTCMTAVRTGHPEWALEALLKDCRTNTYLPNGHNYQDSRLRCYLPGNGGLLTAVALMCAGWDGCTQTLPGFPKDGRWDVRFEGILPMP